MDSGTGTHAYLPCNTAEQLWTVGLVHMCVFTVQHSRATVDSATGTCVYLPCNTEQLWTVGLVHVYLLCSTAEQLWTVVLVHTCVFTNTVQHSNYQWYWHTCVFTVQRSSFGQFTSKWCVYFMTWKMAASGSCVHSVFIDPAAEWLQAGLPNTRLVWAGCTLSKFT